MEARIDTHPPLDSLKAFGLGLLDDASAQALFVHLEDCPPCRRRAEEATGDDFLARLQKARAATPAPARQLPPLPGVARAAGHASTVPPDAARSLGSSLFGDPAPAGPSVPSDVPPELVANPQYEVIRELGRGGMGVVYLARNKQMDRLEVLKVVNRALLERPGTADRFLREIRSAAALEHKNVVRAYACLQAGKLLALVMEYVEGEDLARLVERRGPLSVASACASIVQAARGLQEAHEKGMVHRDIKPQNLLLSRRLKEVMILDFGLAKVASEKGVEQGLTAAGKMLGTPGYVAPEQIRDAASADIRADIYSLGCTLYYLLSGHPPFDAPNLFALLHAHQFTDADPLHEERPNVPPALTAVVARMMAKDPAARYQKPTDVAAALAPFVKGTKPTMPAPPPAPPKPRKQEPTATASVPPPLPVHVQVERVPEPVVERAPFDLEDPPAPAVSKKRKKGNGKWIALALLVPLVVGIAAVILRVETPNGTLIVEMNDPDVEARIKGGKLILTGPDGKDRYILTAADRNSKQKAGEYKIRVAGADGLEVDTPEFTMKKGEVVTVRVKMERKPVVKQDPPKLDPDRKAAEYVLSIGGVVRVNDEVADIKAVADLPREAFRLTHVNLYRNPQVNDAGLVAFEGCKNLKFIDLFVTNVSDTGLAYCKECKDLRELQLHLTKVTDAGLAHFKDCKGFTLLGLGKTAVNGTGLVPFKDCKNLTVLELHNTQVTDGRLACFENCKKITRLHLGGTQVTNAGLAHFKDCKDLSHLDLAETQVNDASLTYLKNFKNLMYVKLIKAKVTAAGIAELKAALPACKIDWDGVPQPKSPLDREAAEFIPLFNGKDLTGWEADGACKEAEWKADANGIRIAGGPAPTWGFLLSKKKYTSFVLRLQFQQMTAGAKTGIIVRGIPGQRFMNLPYQLKVNLRTPDDTGAVLWSTNSVYQKPTAQANLKPALEWNDAEVELRGQTLRVTVNGVLVQNLDLASVAGRPTSLPALAEAPGRIGLQKVTGDVAFRNIEIKELPAKGKAAALDPARKDAEFVPLFNGKNLTGWKTHPEQPGGWTVVRGNLVGRSSGVSAHQLFSERGDY